MDGVERLNNKILVLGATNRPWALDPAIRRRFEKRVYIPLPSRDDRSHIIKLHVGETNHKLSEDDFIELGTVTEGLSASADRSCGRLPLKSPISIATFFNVGSQHPRDVPLFCNPSPPIILTI